MAKRLPPDSPHPGDPTAPSSTAARWAQTQRAKRVLPIALGVMGAVALAVCAAVFGMMRCGDLTASASYVGNTAWMETPVGPRIMLIEGVNRSGDSTSYVANRLVAIDPASGRQTHAWALDTDGDSEHMLLWASRGAWIFTVEGDHWHQSWLARQLAVPGGTGEPGHLVEGALGGVALDAFAPRYPQIVAPWASTAVTGDGLILVESDDKQRWQIDLATGEARPRPGTDVIATGWSGADNTGCFGRLWTHHELVYAFAEREPVRHSQRDHWALIRATPGDYGAIHEDAEVATGFTLPQFACNHTRGTVEVGGQAVIVERLEGGVALSRMDTHGKRAWTWRPPTDAESPAGYTEAWAFGGGVIVRLSRQIIFVGGDGTTGWSVRR